MDDRTTSEGTGTGTGITTSAQVGFEETSTVLPSVERANTAKIGIKGSPYPFVAPSTDYERGWWDELRRLAREAPESWRFRIVDHLKTWAPLLRVMTPDERQAFHDQRLGMAARFTWDIDSARGDGERQEAETKLLQFWTTMLKTRLS